MAISWTLYLMGLIDQNPSLFHARLFSGHFYPSVSELVLGILSNFIAGIFFALFVIYFLRLTGKDYVIFKGAFVGGILSIVQWLFIAALREAYHGDPKCRHSLAYLRR